ncbi:hypothetical protein ABPG75_003490 [Micractinium tetrahymenae]
MGRTLRWELATQLARDVLPALRARGVKLYFVSIGYPERGRKFSEQTGFPPELLLCDPENVTYSALGFKKGVRETFFSPETPLAFWERIKAGKMGDLQAVLGRWTKQELWVPPKKDQAFQQGGAVIFQGRQLLFAHYDRATSAHVDFGLLQREATKGL